MAREVIIKTWCDLCLVEDRHTEGEEIPPIALPDFRGARTAALCEPHRKEVYEPLAALLSGLGQAVEAHPQGAGSRRSGSQRGRPPHPDRDKAVPCGYCGDVPVNRDALQTHVRRVHSKALLEAEQEWAESGAVAPPMRVRPASAAFSCPIDGLVMAKGSVSAHFASQHRGVWPAQALHDAGLLDEPYPCPLEGCVAMFDSVQGAAMHNTRMHVSANLPAWRKGEPIRERDR